MVVVVVVVAADNNNNDYDEEGKINNEYVLSLRFTTRLQRVTLHSSKMQRME